MAGGLARLVQATPVGTRFAVHLCVGDLDHKPMRTPTDSRPLVTLANAIVRRWPDGRSLERVYLPLAAGDVPPPTDPSFYRPLRDLRLPADVRFAAGFLHESRTLDEQRAILDIIEGAFGRPVDVAAACGLGRRAPDLANITLDQARVLTTGEPLTHP